MVTTKQEERDALVKIQKIIADLGPDSYVGAAFQPCFALAEQNIENDFCCSPMDRVKALETEAENCLKKASEKMAEANRQMLKAKELEKKFSIDRDYWEDIRKSLDWATYQLSDKLGY